MILEMSLLDWESKRDLKLVSEKKPRERCEIYRSAKAHLIRGGPISDGILDAKDRETQRLIKNPEWWKDVQIEADMKMYFGGYIAHVAEQRIVLREIEKDPVTHLPYSIGKGRGKALYLDYKTRFDDHYATEVYNKLSRVQMRFGTFLTLTVDAKRFPNLYEATESLKKNWNRIHRSLNRRFGKISYLWVLEFGGLHKMPHLHVLIEKVHFSIEGINWLRALWKKTTATFIKVEVLRDKNAGKYVLKYLKKTFTNDSNSVLDGNAWCYWITNSKFHSESLDVKDRMLTRDEAGEKFINKAEEWSYDFMLDLTEAGRYEYIGTMLVDELGEPPPEVLTDKWLDEKGWLYSEEHGCWFYAGIGDLN